MLELHDVVKHFPAADGGLVRAVDGVSLAVEPGELVALYGPSGSGKTTLLLMIAALLRPDSGSVLVDGRDVFTFSQREAARFRLSVLGFVRQSLHLLESASALDNAALKLMGANVDARTAHRRVMPMLARLGLVAQATHRAEQLSMGERQRVMIARALSAEPKLLLADEPTSSLDSARAQDVLALLGEICRERGVAMLLVTHDPNAAVHADRVHTLRDGVLEDYTPHSSTAAVPVQ
jgi:putative ABC transport system ATP-binding protein